MPCFPGATGKSLVGQARLVEGNLALAVLAQIAKATHMLSSLFGFERRALVLQDLVLEALLALIFEAKFHCQLWTEEDANSRQPDLS
jgi:hypothetical protein